MSKGKDEDREVKAKEEGERDISDARLARAEAACFGVEDWQQVKRELGL
jgi:hypothetical protein